MIRKYNSVDIDNKLIWNLWDISHTMRRISEGKGSQKRILIMLLEAGTLTQRELTQALGIKPGSVSEVLGKLESIDMITRSLSATDHRTADVQLTEEGRVLAEEAARQREKKHQEMFACLSEKEKETLLFLLEKMNFDWENRYCEKVGE